MVKQMEDFLEEVTLDDVSSHIYELYSHPNEHDLGIQSRTSMVKVTIDDVDREFEFQQSLSSLNQQGSTTGFVLWSVSIPFVGWILDDKLSPYDLRGKTVVELGSGVTGLLSCALGPSCKHYISTDQHHILKLLKQNICSNLCDFASSTMHIPSNGGKLKGTVDVVELDWEDLDSGVWNLQQVCSLDSIDYIVACDVVYNDYLIPFLVDAIARLCHESSTVLIALQLRLPENIEQFVEQVLARGLRIWRHLEHCLVPELREGFVIYRITR